MKRLNIFVIEDEYLQDTRQCKVKIVARENIKKKVLDISLIKNMKKIEYFLMVAKTANLAGSSSTIEEKIKICSIFKKIIDPLDMVFEVKSNQK